MERHYSPVDKLFIQADKMLKGLLAPPPKAKRASPAQGLDEPVLSAEERKHAAGLMRVNHTGEVAAQGLYQGQAMTAKLPGIRNKMEHAADEEVDHLHWCQTRLNELDSRASLLKPIWYLGSVTIGALAGLAGDKWSLGFVAETENQVSAHLTSHFEKLPKHDSKSLAIITQMRTDEQAHAQMAVDSGAAALPAGVKWLMKVTAKVMTGTAYYL